MSNNFYTIQSGLRLGNLASDPASAQNGDIYYSTATNTFRGYQNGTWSNVGSSTVTRANIAAGTIKRILFNDPSTGLISEAANFVFDNQSTDGRMGVGTATPQVGGTGGTSAGIHISDGTVLDTAVLPTSTSRLLISASANNFVEHTSTGLNRIRYNRANGTLAAPTAVVDTDELGSFDFRAYTGSALSGRAIIRVLVNGAVSGSTIPTDILFGCGTTSAIERFRIKSDGTINIAGFAAAGVVTNSATGDLATVAPGTSGNVLTSNGSAWVSATPASASPTIFGTRGSPRSIVAATGITSGASHMSTSAIYQDIYLAGSVAGDSVCATITAGTIDGQRMTLIGRDDTQTLTINNTTTNVDTNGPWTGGASNVLKLRWDTVNWHEEGRS